MIGTRSFRDLTPVRWPRPPWRRAGARTSVLIVLSHPVQDGDTTWNALRLATALAAQGAAVRLFVMNDAIDLVRHPVEPPIAEFDLPTMLRALLARGVRVKVCTTCITRCGIGHGDVMPEVLLSSMPELAAWVTGSQRVLVF